MNPQRVQPQKTDDKPIPEGWVPLAGDDSSERIEKIQNGKEAGFISDGLWYVSISVLDSSFFDSSFTAPTISTAASDERYTVQIDPSDYLLLTKILNRDIPAIWRPHSLYNNNDNTWYKSKDTSLWTVFAHPSYGQKVVPYKERKNWVALFFTPIWHIATRTRHGLWLLLALFGVNLLWSVVLLPRVSEEIVRYPSDESVSLLRLSTTVFNIAFACIWLFKANTFRHKSLEARGYKLVDIIEGRTKNEVLAKLKSTS